MKNKIIHLFSICLDISGINAIFRFINRNRGIILWYHGIRSDDTNPSTIYGDMHLPVSVFKMQLNYLKHKGYSFVSLSDLVTSSQAKQSRRKLVTLTFDDGYANVVELAYPIMKNLNAKGVLYVVSGAVKKDRMLWPDRVAVAIDNSNAGNFIFNCGTERFMYELGDRESYRNATADIIKRLRHLPDESRQRTLEQFPNDSYFPDLLRIVTLNQLQSIERQTLEIGSHTQGHAECTKLEAESDYDCELGASKTDLEKMTGYQIDNFCYPSGTFCDDLSEQLAKYGYLTAVTTVPGFVDRKSNLFQLKRLGATSDLPLFKAIISGSIHPLLKLNYNIVNSRGYRK